MSFELGGFARIELVKLQLKGLSDTTHLRQDRLVYGIYRIQQDADVRQARQDLLEQLKPLCIEFRSEERQSGHVPAWPREAGHDA